MGNARRILVATSVHQIQSLGIHNHELYHLAHGKGGLPPHILGVKSDEVVSVHNGVNEAIQDNGQIHITVITNIGVKPVELFTKKKKEKKNNINTDNT